MKLPVGMTFFAAMVAVGLYGCRQRQNIVFSQGRIEVAGTGFNELNAPYDAKVVDDYTGLTAP